MFFALPKVYSVTPKSNRRYFFICSANYYNKIWEIISFFSPINVHQATFQKSSFWPSHSQSGDIPFPPPLPFSSQIPLILQMPLKPLASEWPCLWLFLQGPYSLWLLTLLRAQVSSLQILAWHLGRLQDPPRLQLGSIKSFVGTSYHTCTISMECIKMHQVYANLLLIQMPGSTLVISRNIDICELKMFFVRQFSSWEAICKL